MLRASRRGGQISSRLKPSNFQALQPCNVLPIYPLCFQILAHSSPQRVSHNSFHVNHFRTLFNSTEGVPPLFGPCVPIPYSISFLSALVKNSTLLFSIGSALFAKNTAVWGGASC